MPGVTQCESQTVLAKPSPSKKNRLSLRFFQKKETKRALDFTETPPADIQTEENEPETDQVVPAAELAPPVCCTKKENLIPFVGFNNLGNTCYLNSILQVLSYCPGFKRGVKRLSDIIAKKREVLREDKEQTLDKESTKDAPASYEVICSLSSLIHTVEHLQLSFVSNPDNYDSELAAQPRRLLNTLRELNPMYEGYLQHDAQEVLQCILGNIQEACQALKKETTKSQQGTESIKQVEVDTADPQPDSNGSHSTEAANVIPDSNLSSGCTDGSSETNENGKRKSDNEVGNAKKKTKLTKEQTPEEHRLTRSKRKSASEKAAPQTDASAKTGSENVNSDPSHKRSKLRLSWLRSSKQPSILSKFCSLSKLSGSSTKTETGVKSPKPESGKSELDADSGKNSNGNKEEPSVSETETKPTTPQESTEYELVEKLFQGQLVLRTRCLECESFTERREDFQDISVPVQENETDKVPDSSNISPEPRMETKSLKWAISQFASVERIVGEDKYFCENCHHYTEAERSLLFDKIPEIVTIHLKCFAANSSEFDTYGGLSKVTTPLLTPLTLSLEEWSTKPSRDTYGLFAVVMHSGVTISSGHYTAYVKITDLRELDVDQVKAPSSHRGEIKTEPLTEEEARAVEESYDGEVFCRVGGSTPGVSKVTKKNADTVGLLGGQKSKSDFEHLSNKPSKAEKVSPALTGDRPSDVNGLNHELQPESEGSETKTQVAALCSARTALSLLHSLKEYEGKWLLFDDSEVKVTEERDFLDAISPTTTSTSTPYLLFYKKITEQRP